MGALRSERARPGASEGESATRPMATGCRLVLALAAVLGLGVRATADRTSYAWTSRHVGADALEHRIATPPGYTRGPVPPGSFAAWLRGLPLKPGRPAVRLHDGRPKANQDAHAAVVDIDVGERDLQQCADAVIRLRAEYLFASGRHAAIRFRFTSGDDARFTDWLDGLRPRVEGRRVSWVLQAAPAAPGHDVLRRYLDTVFTYAGSASLVKDTLPVRAGAPLQAGDVFLQGGHPGHAVIVLEVARGPAGAEAFLLAQSYMPAQDLHVLVNPARPGSAWYDAAFGASLATPEWTFRATDRRRFPAVRGE